MNIEQEIQEIKERNVRVAEDKAWERSLSRRFAVTVITYFLAALWLYSIGNASPLLNATIPAGGYFLSTLTLFFIKGLWLRRRGDAR